jgi:hypothetical protein
LNGNKRFWRVPPPLITELLIEFAFLKLQIYDFFVKERGLYRIGMNPKLSSDMACVTSEKIEEVWKKSLSLKTSNTTLKPESRLELLQLYAKIYWKAEVTNNEFMVWVVKSYIAERLGLQVDWATAAASTTQILVSWLEGELLKHEFILEEAAKLQHLAPWAVAKQSSSQSTLEENPMWNDVIIS